MLKIFNNIVFPKTAEMQEHYGLYYRGEKAVLHNNKDKFVMTLRRNSCVDFSTYFNSCSINKWKLFTGIKNVELHLFLKGEGQIKLYGLKKDNGFVKKNFFYDETYKSEAEKEVVLKYPDNNEALVAFEIENFSDGIFYGGYYAGEFENDREVNLSIATTTCKKEAFIKKNVKNLYERILCGNDDIKNHFFVHVVDNGNTLQQLDFPQSDSILLHPNHNTGGAGGFARGMIECLHQEKPKSVTHVLLMDDDVIIEPESIYRTYVLLKHLKEEYHKRFISGAMLYMENPTIQKEDVGSVTDMGYFEPWKREFDYNRLVDVIENEDIIPETDNSYAAWWYCCIPIETIREKGLPLPVFVRGDDVEYGLRCRPSFITMNAIGVWHMGFVGKVNIGMDHYQVNRNLLVDQSTSGVIPEVRVIDKIKIDFKNHIYRLDYDSAEIVVRALEDYNKGPDFLKDDRGFNILVDNNALGHKMVPLSELGDPDWGYGDPFVDFKWSLRNKIFFKLTDNGHRFWIGKYKKGIMNIPYLPAYTPVRCSFRNELVAMNPQTRMGYILKRDNERYRLLKKRFDIALKYYKKNKEYLKKQYRKSQKEFVSEQFWKKYLGI